MLMRNRQLLVAAATFILGANVKGHVPDEPLLGAGGDGAKQDRGENGQQQHEGRKPPMHSQPFCHSPTHAAIMAASP